MSYLSLIVLLRELLKKEIIYKGTLYYRLLRDFPGFLAQLLRLAQQPGSSRPLNSGKLWGPQQERFAFAWPHTALRLRPGERPAAAYLFGAPLSAPRVLLHGNDQRIAIHVESVWTQAVIDFNDLTAVEFHVRDDIAEAVIPHLFKEFLR